MSFAGYDSGKTRNPADEYLGPEPKPPIPDCAAVEGHVWERITDDGRPYVRCTNCGEEVHDQ